MSLLHQPGGHTEHRGEGLVIEYQEAQMVQHRAPAEPSLVLRRFVGFALGRTNDLQLALSCITLGLCFRGGLR
jgi:hypothetical protein